MEEANERYINGLSEKVNRCEHIRNYQGVGYCYVEDMECLSKRGEVREYVVKLPLEGRKIIFGCDGKL